MLRFQIGVVAFGLMSAILAVDVGDAEARADSPLPEEAYSSVLNQPATEEALDRAVAALSAAGCTGIACLSMQDISQAESLLLRRDLPGGNTLRDPKAFNPELFDRQVDRLLIVHPERNPYRCAILIKIARHSATQTSWTAETDPGFWLRAIDIASRIRLADSECLTDFLAALPPTQAARTLVEQAREYCNAVPLSRCSRTLSPR